MKTLKSHSLLFILILNVFCCIAQTSSLVSVGSNGKLVYTADVKGNVIPDYSGVGYRNSETPIPNVPVVLTISPVSGDDKTSIQNAINSVSARTPDANGFRGAILLNAGTYQLSTSVTISASGVVLRGVGNSTILQATGTVQYDLINIKGTNGKTEISSSQMQITNSFVPVGAKTINVGSGHSFAVGDWVHVRREPNSSWIQLLGMDKLSLIEPDATNWTASAYKISYERKIVSVNGNTLTLDAPVMDIIDPKYANGFVVKFTSARINNSAVENMKIESSYSSSTDENHGWSAIVFDKAEHSWVKGVSCYYFGYSCVDVAAGASFITVENCSMLDPVSIITGGRRYSFNVDGQRCLVQNCTTRGGRHDYVNGSRTPGPSVFYNCTATQQYADMGPHHRWSTGILLDNIVGDGQLRVQNRLASGSGHGWSGSQIMFWNCQSPNIVIQDPPSFHRNWAIGCIGSITNVGQWKTEPLGIVESQGTKISAIPSLFIAQLDDRLKPAAPSNLTAIALSPTDIKLTWSDNSNDETEFYIQRQSSSGSWMAVVNLPANTTTFTHTERVENTSYTYRVLARKGTHNSSWSNNATVTTPPSMSIFLPEADAYVYGGDVVSNFGTVTDLLVKNSGNVAYFRKIYLKYNLTGLSNPGNAKVRLYANSVSGAFPVSIYKVGDNWTETGITYNNALANGTLIGSVNVSASGLYYEWDVSTYVQNQIAKNDFIVSFILDDAGVANQLIKFNSRESSANKPQLVIESARSNAKRQHDVSDYISDKVSFNIFPNPVSDVLNFKVNLKQGENYQISIFDLNGKTIKSLMFEHMASGDQERSIDLTNFKKGIYLLRLTSPSLNQIHKLIVK